MQQPEVKVETYREPRKRRNVRRATQAGVVAGGGGAAVIAWGSVAIEAKTGIPAPVVATVLGSTFAFLARWAAKLNPSD